MKLTPEQFINFLSTGKTEKEASRNESDYINPAELKKLTGKRYGHTIESATDHLLTDYSDGFTICKHCGTYFHLGKGFTKHISDGCLNCEGEEKHRVCHVNASKPSEGGLPARWMSQYFDDGMHYTKDKAEVEKYKKHLPIQV